MSEEQTPAVGGTMRRFVLERIEDVSGVSGTGIVAEGCVFSDGAVVMRWTSEWPTSVVWHDRGVESLEHVHGHNGRTRIVWIDDDPEALREMLGQACVALDNIANPNLTDADLDRIHHAWDALQTVREMGQDPKKLWGPRRRLAKQRDEARARHTWPKSTPSGHTYEIPATYEALCHRHNDAAQAQAENWDDAERPPEPTWEMVGLAHDEIRRLRLELDELDSGSTSPDGDPS